MTQQDSGPTPNEATKAAEERDARAAHTADREPTVEEAEAAPGRTSSATQKDFKEMTERGAQVKGEGELP
ncbi:MAG: hypothetical protein M0Z30_08940 [Actinomycetota bacterium]|nr:hypothetical protein [Actinomycetota bacterium]